MILRDAFPERPVAVVAPPVAGLFLSSEKARTYQGKGGTLKRPHPILLEILKQGRPLTTNEGPVISVNPPVAKVRNTPQPSELAGEPAITGVSNVSDGSITDLTRKGTESGVMPELCRRPLQLHPDQTTPPNTRSATLSAIAGGICLCEKLDSRD